MSETKTLNVTSEPIRLVGSGTFEQLEGSIRCLLFGEILKLGLKYVERYHSDFYHDARWIEERVHGARTMIFAVDSNGTFLLNDNDTVPHDLRKNMFRVELFETRGTWFVTFEQIKGGENV